MGPLLIDVLLVTTFAAIGRLSHDEAVLAGLWRTAWPFLAGLGIGWLALLRMGCPAVAVRSGVLVWGTTLVGGMLLRVLSGQGTALSCVIVAGVVLAVFLIGWRAVAAAVTRRRGRPARPA